MKDVVENERVFNAAGQLEKGGEGHQVDEALQLDEPPGPGNQRRPRPAEHPRRGEQEAEVVEGHPQSNEEHCQEGKLDPQGQIGE